MKTIPLTQGFETMVDDEDFEELNKYKWFVKDIKEDNTYYAHKHFYKECGERSNICMHTIIMNTPKGMVIDHIDGNGLNNCKSNLRIVTNRQNCQNKHISQTSNYAGVSWHKASRKWRATILVDKKQKHLGTFEIEEDAHNAYLKALNEINEIFVEDINTREGVIFMS